MSSQGSKTGPEQTDERLRNHDQVRSEPLYLVYAGFDWTQTGGAQRPCTVAGASFRTRVEGFGSATFRTPHGPRLMSNTKLKFMLAKANRLLHLNEEFVSKQIS